LHLEKPRAAEGDLRWSHQPVSARGEGPETIWSSWETSHGQRGATMVLGNTGLAQSPSSKEADGAVA